MNAPVHQARAVRYAFEQRDFEQNGGSAIQRKPIWQWVDLPRNKGFLGFFAFLH